MNISKTALWLSVLIAILVLLASGAGLLLSGTYARETASYGLQSVGQDLENLLAASALLLTASFARQGSVRAFLLWMGVLLALIYSYVIYAFAVHFNNLFLVYVAILGLSFYTLVGSVIRLPLSRLQGAFAVTSTARVVSVFFVVVVLLFSLQWLGEDIPALLGGKLPQSVTENGLLTNPVHVLDLGLLLPAMLITVILLWRGKLLGSLLALPLLVFSILTGVGILATFLIMDMNGMSTSPVVELLFAVIVLVSLVLSVLFARDIQEQSAVSFV